MMMGRPPGCVVYGLCRLTGTAAGWPVTRVAAGAAQGPTFQTGLLAS